MYFQDEYEGFSEEEKQEVSKFLIEENEGK